MKGTTIKIKRWGNGNGILLPKTLLEMFSLRTNDELSLEIKDDSIMLSPVKKQHKTLTERFAGYNGESKQPEYWTDTLVGKEEF